MNPSGLQVNKPVAAAIGIGVIVVIYLWFRYTSPTAVTELSMDVLDKAKSAIDKVTVHHEKSLTFKVEGKDVTIAYREVRPDQPKLDILFLHGMRFKSETWVSKPVYTLQMMYYFDYRAVAIDLPGYGESPSAEVNKGEFINEAIKALGLKKPVIVSPSMSGSFALPYLFSDPESALSRCRGYVPVAPVNTEKFVEQYKKVQVPTLIIYGSTDTNIGYTSRDNLKGIPSSKVVELSGAGHACYLDKPDEFHKHLHTFLVSLEGKDS